MKIFGYGSLINQESARKTLKTARNFQKAYLEGYKREFNLMTTKRLTEDGKSCCAVLNITKDPNTTINGVVFEIDDYEFEAYTKRECDYEIIQLDILLENKQYEKVYTVINTTKNNGEFVFESEKQKEYLKICLDGCREYGEEFTKQFLETTYIDDEPLSKIDIIQLLENQILIPNTIKLKN